MLVSFNDGIKASFPGQWLHILKTEDPNNGELDTIFLLENDNTQTVRKTSIPQEDRAQDTDLHIFFYCPKTKLFI